MAGYYVSTFSNNKHLLDANTYIVTLYVILLFFVPNADYLNISGTIFLCMTEANGGKRIPFIFLQVR